MQVVRLHASVLCIRRFLELGERIVVADGYVDHETLLRASAHKALVSAALHDDEMRRLTLSSCCRSVYCRRYILASARLVVCIEVSGSIFHIPRLITTESTLLGMRYSTLYHL
jgi:hypothetical protein